MRERKRAFVTAITLSEFYDREHSLLTTKRNIIWKINFKSIRDRNNCMTFFAVKRNPLTDFQFFEK